MGRLDIVTKILRLTSLILAGVTVALVVARHEAIFLERLFVLIVSLVLIISFVWVGVLTFLHIRGIEDEKIIRTTTIIDFGYHLSAAGLLLCGVTTWFVSVERIGNIKEYRFEINDFIVTPKNTRDYHARIFGGVFGVLTLVVYLALGILVLLSFLKKI